MLVPADCITVIKRTRVKALAEHGVLCGHHATVCSVPAMVENVGLGLFSRGVFATASIWFVGLVIPKNLLTEVECFLLVCPSVA